MDNSYIVTYWTPLNGAILYSVTEVKNYEGEYFRVYALKKIPQENTLLQTPNYSFNANVGYGWAIEGAVIVGAAIFGARLVSDQMSKL